MTEPQDLALPTGYTDLLGELKDRVREARTKATRTVNTQLIELYWSIGRTILERQDVENWVQQPVAQLPWGHITVLLDKTETPEQRETIGILICGSKNDRSFRYSLGRATSPMAVAAYTYDALPVTCSRDFPTRSIQPRPWSGHKRT